MINVVSMFGVKIRPHRSFFFIIGILLCFIILFLLKSNEKRVSTKTTEIVSDEDINLIDLFDRAFQLTYQAGEVIRQSKTTKLNFGNIFKRKSLKKLKNEPVTIADLLSHTIITDGLKNKFPNLKIVSEEKDTINSREFKLIQEQLKSPEKNIRSPMIYEEKQFVTVPLSSVAVWVDPLDATKEFTENLLQYVTVMVCVTVEHKPTIGIVYAPFTNKLTWAWVGIDHSVIKRDETVLLNPHKSTVDEIIVSRSHAGQVLEILRNIYHDKQYKVLPAAGSAYKTIQVLEEYADYYLHITPIKKWDVCAPDAILRANHGTMTTLTNQTIDYDPQNKQMLITDGILATYKRNHNDLLKFLTKSNLTKYLHPEKHR